MAGCDASIASLFRRIKPRPQGFYDKCEEALRSQDLFEIGDLVELPENTLKKSLEASGATAGMVMFLLQAEDFQLDVFNAREAFWDREYVSFTVFVFTVFVFTVFHILCSSSYVVFIYSSHSLTPICLLFTVNCIHRFILYTARCYCSLCPPFTVHCSPFTHRYNHGSEDSIDFMGRVRYPPRLCVQVRHHSYTMI